MIIGYIAVFAFVATLLGGLFALRLRDKLHVILGFSAGAIIGVAFFDLLPEALELAGSSVEASVILATTALGFLLYLGLDRLVLLHGHDDEHAHAKRGVFGALSLSTHSFLDGIGIGLAFQVSAPVGVVIAVAVLTHDFSDGINTVNMILRNGGGRAKAIRWLLVDALAPVAGILVGMLFLVPC
jgi:ZIP family zinc transporter